MATVLTDLAIRISANIAELQKNLQLAKGSVENFKGQVSNASKTMATGFKEASKNISNSLNIMTGGMSGMLSTGLSAFKGLITGVRGFAAAFAATGIGAIIMAVSLAIAGLVAAFKRSGEAADGMEKALGFLKGVLNYLVGILVKVGELLVKAFSDPKTAIKELWQMIKDNLVTRFKGVIDVFVGGWEIIKNGAMGVAYAIKGIFSEDARKESKEYFQKMADGLKKTGEGIVALTTGKTVDDLKKIAEEIKKTGQEGAKVAEMEDALVELKIKRLYEEEAIAKKLAETKTKIAEQSSATEEGIRKKQELTAEAIKLQNKLSGYAVQIAKAEYDLALAQAALRKGDTSDETRTELAEKYNAWQKAITASEEAILGLKKRETGIDDKLLKAEEERAKAAADYAEKMKKLTEENKLLQLKSEEELAVQRLAFQRDDLLRESKTAEEQALIWDNYSMQVDKIFKDLQDKKADEAKSALEQSLNDELKYSAKTAEEQLAIYQQMLAAELISKAEFDAKIAEMDELAKQKKYENVQFGLESASQALDAISQLNQASMNKELSLAGDNEQKKEEIRKKYAKREKALAIIQALINGAVGFTKALAQGGIMGFVTGALVAAATAAQIAVIKSQPLAEGGLAYGQTFAMVGEYPGAHQNPEVIAPLDKLKSIIGEQPMQGQVKFVIEQNQLVGILQKAENKQIYF